ncbi:MAG TPA: hypothetical protein VKR22_05850 [Acidimicrobiales bacterium]|nr:hypothetical protein [Acidimicrobiales bacterium]
MNGRARRAGLAGRAGLAALAVASVALSGCVSPRNALGTTSSQCYRAVPVASEAVHDRGRLAGVRLVGQKELDRHPRMIDLLTSRVGGQVHQVCVISFHGQFRLDGVERPAGPAPSGGSGPVAVVVVSVPQNRLVATFVVEREPLPLRHEVLGPLRRYRPGVSGPPGGPSGPSGGGSGLAGGL